MPTTAIKVSFVNEPKPGKKMGSIRTDDGVYYSVYPEKLDMFLPGQSYRINYTTSASGYHTFKNMATDAEIDGPIVVPLMVANGRGAPAQPAHTKSVEMFVMGVIGRTLQSTGTVPDVGTLTLWVRHLRRAWADGFTAPGAISPDDPSDEIPF